LTVDTLFVNKQLFNKYIIPLANSGATEIIGDFVSLFFPRYCAGCEDSLAKGEALICSRCILEMPRSDYHLEIENPFYNKFKGRIPLKYVLSLFKFVKAGRVQQVLHSLKYKNKPEIGQMLGKVYGSELLQHGYLDKFDLIIPVPLHASKKRKRGYNQSEEFGIGLSDSLSIPCSDTYLKRLHVTETQTKKTKLKRWENVSEVFALHDNTPVKDKRVLLVDDVVTTGATLEAAGRALLEGGCKELSIACIAATQ
jgi:ComF family protein